MSTSRRSLLAGGLALPLLAMAGCSDTPGVSAEYGFAEGDGSYAVVPPEKRVAAPELSGTTLDGRKLTVSAYKGKVVVVNVWGSWCPPCRHEAPELVEAARKTAGTAQFVGLNTRDNSQENALAFLRTAGITYPNLYDPDGRLLLTFGVLPPTAIPSTLFIDRQGRVAARILGEASASTLVGAITDIAAGK